ncbi:cell division ATP-binding protein FtsE [Dietzia sp. PP-33]|uniref:cell division ATP-binding protein FtsE n=1 Tax=Dietzia sp. PP-33 TaxID=2957500 RepID=UPI0029A9D8B2|nr:cell division ATP-binding protein FtsE [Dietzia sp. PP-33]MDX2356621.1 cell division ATP-binding protein FtsE [Dietzia sp. PP-33]
MISASHVTKSYASSTRPALSDVSVEIATGEFAFLIGASGSGKSTFLRLVLREDRIDSGKLVVAGHDLTRMKTSSVPALRRTLGCVFQDFRLLQGKTVAENVAFALQVIGKSRRTIDKVVPETLEMVGLGREAGRRPHELSGGEQQRVAIARAFVNRPQLLLADEPTGNLDPETSEDIMLLLDRINRTGTTVLMATHDRHIVDRSRRRVVELVDGKVVRDDSRGTYGVGR